MILKMQLQATETSLKRDFVKMLQKKKNNQVILKSNAEHMGDSWKAVEI